MYEIRGIHHVTGMVRDANECLRFFREILGMRFVKKTVNHDEWTAYHLYFSDDNGSAGSILDFFAFPDQERGIGWADGVSLVTLRVRNDEALGWWQERFKRLEVVTGEIADLFGEKILPFEDADGMHYALISDEWDAGELGGTPWKKSDVPANYGIIGLGPLVFEMRDIRPLDMILRDVLAYELTGESEEFLFYEVDGGGNAASILVKRSDDEVQNPGFGRIHHTAQRVSDTESLIFWHDRLKSFGLQVSEIVDRKYFQSIYFGAAPGVLLELSTEGPGFFVDETYDKSGTALMLPPELEARRLEIESLLPPLFGE